MPSAPIWSRNLMQEYFGDPVSDVGPSEYLIAQGYKLTDSHEWIKPSPGHTPTEKEASCIGFLIMEWDWGGIAGEDEGS